MAQGEKQAELNSVAKSYDSTATKDSGESSVSFELLLLNLGKAEKAQMASMERLAAAQKLWDEQIFQKRVADINEQYADEQTRASKIKELREKQEEEILDIALKMEETLYKFSTKKQKIQIMAERAETLKTTKLKIQQQMREVALSNENGNEKNAQFKKLRQQYIEANNEEIAAQQQKRNLMIAEFNERRSYGAVTQAELEQQNALISKSFEDEKKNHQEKLSFIDAEIARLEKQKAEGNSEDGGEIDKEIEQLKGQKDDTKKAAQKTENKRMSTELGNSIKAGFNNFGGKLLDNLGGKFNQGVDDAINTVGQYRSSIEARLQETGSGYDEIAKTLKSTLAVSPFVKQKDVIAKINDAVSKGIAYNVEQRAFLETVKDKIVATFDAFDSNLMRIIRLQQADTTAARMGMEANLLKFFNSTFSDNSYLTEGYDDVSKALIDANAQMSRDMSIAFEYNVQKWLGSLSSLGFGTETINKIAEGVNYLGSGNVQALSGDTELMNLMAMSANRAGYSISDLLVQGIDDSSVNELLKSMVEYLAEIAEDNNAVVKAAYGDVFNFSQSDLRAIKNLNKSDISNIYKQEMSYTTAMDEIQSQLYSVGSRLSTTEMIDNVFDNFIYTAGESIANNMVTAVTWKMLTALEEVTGGIKIPFVNVYGFGLDLNMSMESLLKTGMFGLSALGNIGNIVTSVMSGGGLNLGMWDTEEYTKRGGDFDSTVGGVQKTTSGSAKAVSSSASSDQKKAAIDSTSEDQENQKKSSKESMDEEITVKTLYNEIFEAKSIMYVHDIPTYEQVYSIAEYVPNMKSDLCDIKTATASIKKDVNDIVSKIKTDQGGNGILVKVTNMSDVTDEFKNLKPIETMSISNLGGLSEAIMSGLNGVTYSNDDTESEYTLQDLINKLMAGGDYVKVNAKYLSTIKDYAENISNNTR